MRTNQVVNGEPVKVIDYAYMGILKRIFRPFGYEPKCRWQGCEHPEFKEGDRVVSKLKKQRGLRAPPIWHAECFRRLYY